MTKIVIGVLLMVIGAVLSLVGEANTGPTGQRRHRTRTKEQRRPQFDKSVLDALHKCASCQEDPTLVVMRAAGGEPAYTLSGLIGELENRTEFGREQFQLYHEFAKILGPERLVERLGSVGMSAERLPEPPQPQTAEVMLIMLFSGAISPDTAGRFLVNQRYLGERREEIERDFDGKWVAMLGGRLYAADGVDQLLDTLGKEADHGSAYIERVVKR